MTTIRVYAVLGINQFMPITELCRVGIRPILYLILFLITSQSS